ncbi:FAD:protein FMN transferase [Psychrosphaera aquimarina]|uniref:FAD:protein FMN transferase n=1 Tax=Psychrosphaera aquimarina TaxID=2044854 RepID=A0ABU3R465_9GAMM|nr:FAD:protein FMN transferase [Psychrosphaera aquimarina]MDU0114267.1 FAD:protein FMN transferase [Psychrosphaera aquimarina]
MASKVKVTQKEDCIQVAFTAMASPCYLLIEGQDAKQHQDFIKQTLREVQRLEQKFSRYLPDSVCSKINASNGKPVKIDPETYNLFKYAKELYEISEGLFDITSGVLRRAWTFSNEMVTPSQSTIDKVLPFVGWKKMKFELDAITLKNGMEVDFGGIAKEYAVSYIAEIGRKQLPNHSILINLGGDIEISQERTDGKKWTIGIERRNQELQVVQLNKGAMATSGDTHRFVIINNQRYSHILNPMTGWPIKQTVSTVTVTARSCIQAGSIATLALLHGKNTEAFLSTQKGIKYVVNK